jgi:hypothetical protein
MTRYEGPEPAGTPELAGVPVDITDRMLWRDAQQMLDRHAEPGADGRCGWCGWQWPCPPRRLAERAEAAARRPWRESWTARHDLNGLRGLPSWRGDRAAGPAGRDPARPPARPGGRARPRHNGGLFD